MSTKAQTYIPRHASLDEFDLIRGQVLLGRRLRDIQILENSIARFGLLSPLIALKKSKRLTVIDGRKRLTAIRRLEFQGRLPSSLSRLPYFLPTRQRRLSLLHRLFSPIQAYLMPCKLSSSAAHLPAPLQIDSRSLVSACVISCRFRVCLPWFVWPFLTARSIFHKRAPTPPFLVFTNRIFA